MPDLLQPGSQYMDLMPENHASNASLNEVLNNSIGNVSDYYEPWMDKVDPTLAMLYQSIAMLVDTNSVHRDFFRQIVPQVLPSLKDMIEKRDYLGIQGLLAAFTNRNVTFDPQFEKWLDNMISKQNTEQSQDWEEDMASNDLLRAASQLQSLGLSTSNVIQTGGSGVNAVGAANNSMTNLSQQTKMQRYQQKMALARSILSMTSQMASAGIYGGAIGAARHAASTITSAASHSALEALSDTKKHPFERFNKGEFEDGYSRDELLKMLDM